MAHQTMAAVLTLALAVCVPLGIATAQNSTEKKQSKVSGAQRAACVAKYKVWSKAFNDKNSEDLELAEWTEADEEPAFRQFMATCTKYGPNSAVMRGIMSQ